LISISSARSSGPVGPLFWTTTGGPRSAPRHTTFELNMGWRVVPGAFDGGTTDPETGRPRLLALRLPSVRTGLRALPAILTRSAHLPSPLRVR
jgi:hypothetical protein